MSLQHLTNGGDDVMEKNHNNYLERLVQLAAKNLPSGVTLQIDIERHAGTVRLWNQDGY